MASHIDDQVIQFREKIMPRLIERFQPQQVLLFGSRATDSALEDSDLDIIIISEKFQGLPWPQRVFEVLWTLKSPIPLDVLCYTPEEVQARSQEVDWVAQALNHGVVLFKSM